MASTIKIAISIQKSLFEEAENLAQELNVSRSELFGLAIEAFVRSHQNQKLLEEINQAYSDEPDRAEKIRLTKMRKHHRKMVRNAWSSIKVISIGSSWMSLKAPSLATAILMLSYKITSLTPAK